MTQLQDIVNQIRTMTNTENSQYVTDAELAIYANSSFAELDDILIDNEQYYSLKTSFPTIASGNLIPLPADCYQVNQLDYFYSASQTLPWQTLEKYMLKEQTMYSNSLARNMYGVPSLRYMLQDGYIAIVPETMAVGSYRLWYTPIFTIMALTDTIPSYFENNAWREYAVVDCCIKVYNKMTLDPSIFMAQKEGLRVRIDKMASKRDAGSPMHVVNTTQAGSEWGNGFGWGSGGGW